MRLVYCFLFCSLLTGSVTAQKWPFELWHDGKVILTNGDTIRGFIKYDLQQDLVQCDDRRNKIEAFSARKVLSFEIFDATVSKYRNFYALPYAATSGYRAPVFFELLAEGKMTLLAREAVEYKTYSSPYYYGSYSRQVLVYKFFFLEENGNISEFIGKKADLLNLMGRKSGTVEKYIKTNRLKIEDRDDFAKIVSYYNSLFKT